ncbi:Chlorovirus glycoprotein repeat domain-containing protein [Acanthocystis turfacea Chlorella virus TN603.4.2]|nr:Chlorovirus glycoprotein repeat domain-containing protein [Acanthocystis turfacea Chlorella virus TN603.4.2]
MSSSSVFRDYIRKQAGINTYTGDYLLAGNITVEGNGSVIRGASNLSPISYTDVLGNLYGNSVTVAGNVTGGLLIGNGSRITGTSSASVPKAINSNISGNLSGSFASMSGNVTARYFFGSGTGLTGIVSTVPSKGNINIDGNIFATGNVDATNVSVSLLRVNGNVVVNGQVNAAMLVASYFVGNGSRITGINATVPSNANIDITGNVTSTANVDAYANVDANTLTVGNITIAANVSAANIVSSGYFIGNGSQLTSLLPRTISTDIIGNVNAAGNVSTSKYLIGNALNMYFAGNLVTVLGNVANASVRLALTNVPLGGIYTQLDTNSQYLLAYQPPSFAVNWVPLTNTNFPVTSAFGRLGDVVLISGVDIKTLGGAPIVGTGDIVSANIDIIGNVTGNVTTAVLDSGNANVRTISVAGQVKVLGNLFSSKNFIGNGIYLVGTPAPVVGNANIDIIGNVRAPGNVNGTNIVANSMRIYKNANVLGQIKALGNIVISPQYFIKGDGTTLTNANVGNATGLKFTNIFGNVDATGNADALNTISANIVRVNANAFVGGNIFTSQVFVANTYFGNGSFLTGLTTITGNQRADITGNVSASGNVVCASISLVSNIRVGGNINVTGQVYSTTGNIGAQYFVGDGSKITPLYASGLQSVDITGNVTSTGGNVDATNVSTTWLIVNANAVVTGQVNVEGNIIVLAGGVGTLKGDGSRISGIVPVLSGTSNINITGNVVAAGNVDAANISTGNVRVNQNVWVLGQIAATGNIIVQSPSFFFGNGVGLSNLTISGTQNIDIRGNVSAPGNVETANVTANSMVVNRNVINTGQVQVTGNVIANYLIGNGFGLTSVVASSGVVASFVNPNGISFSCNVANTISYANAWTFVLSSTQPRFITIRTSTLPPNSNAPFTTLPSNVTQTLANAWTYSPTGTWTGVVRLQAGNAFAAASNNLVMNYHTSFGVFNGFSSETFCSAV